GEWLQKERERLRHLAVGGLCRLAQLRQEAGVAQAALETAQRVLSIDGYCQEAHRKVIELHLCTGGIPSTRSHAIACKELFHRGNIEREPATWDIRAEVIDASPRSENLAPVVGSDARPPRKLAAILSADVDDYSRHMQRDEDGTFNRLRQYRK